MTSEVTIPVLALSLVAVALLFAQGFAAVILSALNRITRSQAAEAHADLSGGPYLARIVDRRPAAISVTSGTRAVLLILFGGIIFALSSLLAHNVWLVLLLVLAFGCLLLVISYSILPPAIGYKHPIQVLRLAGTLLWLATRISSIFITRRDSADEEERESEKEDQLAVMVEHVAESEAIEDDERNFIHSVFEMSRTLVREVMVPRTDMLSIDSDATLDDAVSLFTRSGFSRVPVVGENSDDVLGMIYLKDAIRRIHHRSGGAELSVTDIMREPFFVPETKKADDLLAEMRDHSVHIALVVDEYGGTAGLVTIEDLLEELVGEMVDEHDRALQEVEEIEDGVFRVPARMPVDELGELFDQRIEDDDVDTVGGLLAKGLGRVPILGSQANIEGLSLTADRFEGRRKRLSWVIATRAEEKEVTADE